MYTEYFDYLKADDITKLEAVGLHIYDLVETGDTELEIFDRKSFKSYDSQGYGAFVKYGYFISTNEERTKNRLYSTGTIFDKTHFSVNSAPLPHSGKNDEFVQAISDYLQTGMIPDFFEQYVIVDESRVSTVTKSLIKEEPYQMHFVDYNALSTEEIKDLTSDLKTFPLLAKVIEVNKNDSCISVYEGAYDCIKWSEREIPNNYEVEIAE